MNIAWLQDLPPFGDSGGAQQTDRNHIVAGLRRGHNIEVILPNQAHDPKWADLVVISNATAFPVDMLKTLSRPYVMFLHDYFALCRWRLFYPMLDKCRDCFQKPRYLPLLLGSNLIIWLSPLHRESWLFTYPELAGHPHALVPSAIDVDEFFDLGLPRNGVIAVSSGAKFKGYERFRKWAEEHRETPVTLVGSVEGPLPGNVTVVSGVPPREMNFLYNRHETFWHQPLTPQPFERTCAEAYLAGCTVLGNELVGALSWPFFREGRDEVRNSLRCATTIFWEAVEKAV